MPKESAWVPTPEDVASRIEMGLSCDDVAEAVAGWNLARRAMLMARARQLLRAKRKEQRRKEAEQRRALAKLIRQNTPKTPPAPCCVCGKYKAIAQRHHVRRVCDAGRHDQDAYETVRLCPNCHAIAHLMASGSINPLDPEVFGMRSPEEWGRMDPLVRALQNAAGI
jgi:hypothetical protein